MNAYPVQYEVEYQKEHSRLTTLFRMILVIPAMIFASIYTLIAFIATVIAWFVLVFTARYPEGLYNFVAGYVRIAGRLFAYEFLLTDAYPPFSAGQEPNYPCQVTVGARQEEYSRAKVFFRLIVGIPTMIMNWLFSLWAELMAIAAWFVIIFTGRLPFGLYEQQILAERYRARASAYLTLLTDRQPPISDKPAGEAAAPVAESAPPPPAEGTAPPPGGDAPPPPPTQ